MEPEVENGDWAAFARPMSIEPMDGSSYPAQSGLTKREYFAGKILAALLTGPDESGSSAQSLADYAVESADALLAALSLHAA